MGGGRASQGRARGRSLPAGPALDACGRPSCPATRTPRSLHCAPESRPRSWVGSRHWKLLPEPGAHSPQIGCSVPPLHQRGAGGGGCERGCPQRGHGWVPKQGDRHLGELWRTVGLWRGACRVGTPLQWLIPMPLLAFYLQLGHPRSNCRPDPLPSPPRPAPSPYTPLHTSKVTTSDGPQTEQRLRTAGPESRGVGQHRDHTSSGDRDPSPGRGRMATGTGPDQPRTEAAG